MITYNSKYLLVASCESLVPSYVQHLKAKGTKADKLKDPLDALRKKLARIVEEKFQKNGEATLVIGCMHYPQDANESFVQTQTLPADLNPKKLCRNENHSHLKAVTIDMRCSPDEVMEYQLMTKATIFLPTPFPQVHPHGPDFARRNFSIISHIEDFKHVKGIKKIYIERVPDFEKGPTAQNLAAIKAMHKLLDQGGIFAFDFAPFFDIFSNDRTNFTYLSNRSLPVARTIKNEEFAQLCRVIHRPGLKEYTGLSCSHSKCPTEPCDELTRVVANNILQARVQQERLTVLSNACREEIKGKPKAALANQELLVKADNRIFTLEQFVRTQDNLSHSQLCGIAIFSIFQRSQAEMESLLYQLECYRSLPVDGSLVNEIDPNIKRGLDEGLHNLVQKIVFPQLQRLGFEKLSFSLNGANLENGRQFNRVIYVQKK